jgi:hypothetical protein
MVAPAHYIKGNAASRWPHRWIVWDSETQWVTEGDVTTHTFRLACAAWWDHKSKRHVEPEYASFRDVRSLWEWTSAHCEPQGRTIAYAHNLSFDLQVCRMFDIMPNLGWELAWFNLSNDSSLVEWKRGKQTLILTDSMSLFPTALRKIATLVGDEKPELPANDASEDEWLWRCQSDVRVLTAAVRTFNEWARMFDVGNWRASGSGLAWSLWRHKFLGEKILASSGPENAAAERAGMVTGRAEAWRTGEAPEGGLHDWDMSRCYCTIASQCEVPIRHRITVPSLTVEQYKGWRAQGAVLSHVTVTQDKPIVGVQDGKGFRWPVSRFETWLWDPELDLLLDSGARVEFGESRRYWRAPALQAWAEWTLAELTPETTTVPPVVALWVKAQSRSLIGRFGMRYHNWEPHPDGNGLDITGLSKEAGPGWGPRTVMHAAGKAWFEGERTDSDDCAPMITGWIMSEARVRLWRALRAAGEGHVWHVDTDGLLVDLEGRKRLRQHARQHPGEGWTEKGSYYAGEVRGTRNYTLGEREHIAGVPSDAVRVGPAAWKGEMWQGIKQGLREGRVDQVRVRATTWELTAPDSRRVHLPDGSTRAYAPGEYAELRASRAR